MLALAAVSLVPTAAAREAALPDTSQPAASDSRVTYGPDYFARYNPSTAEDILKIIPGVQSILDEAKPSREERGFGSGGARVLLNGRRFPGKANDLAANLRRIPHDAVARVELISGAVDDIAVQSEGTLVNVVLREGASIAGTGTWEAYVRFNDQGRTELDGLVSYNGSFNGVGYTIGIERNAWSPEVYGPIRWSDRTRDEVYYYPDFTVQERRPQDWSRDHDKWIYTGGLSYDFVRGDRLQLNGFLQTIDVTTSDRTPFTRYGPAGNMTLQALDLHERDQNPWDTLELSGDYEGAWFGGQLNALAIHKRETILTEDFRRLVIADRTIERSRSLSDVEIGEDILRATWTRPLNADMSVEIGAEGAKNFRDQSLRVFFDIDADDLVEEVVVPTGNAHVEEQRAEAFLTHRWKPTAKLSLDTSLTYETSEITNNYDFSPDRSLSFWRPRLDARYKVTPRQQARLLVERTVSQLDFENFTPRYDFVDEEIDAGNPGIEPEKAWEYELGYTYRLPKDGGRIEGRVFYKDITDAIDKVPIFDPIRGVYSAEGNIPDAEVHGAEIKTSLRLTPLSLRDAIVSVQYTWQDSDISDPFTGQGRRLRADNGDNYEVSYRHDITKAGLSYGATYRHPGHAMIYSDLDSTARFHIGPRLSAFAEKKLWGDMALRIEAHNIESGNESRSRALYADTVFGGTVRQIQTWEEDRDTRVAIGLRGTF